MAIWLSRNRCYKSLMFPALCLTLLVSIVASEGSSMRPGRIVWPNNAPQLRDAASRTGSVTNSRSLAAAITLQGNCSGDYASVHYLAANEYLSTIAQICSITTTAVVAGNPQITDPNVVFAGLPVCVPPGCCTALKCIGVSATSSINSGPQTCSGAYAATHLLAKGEYISAVAASCSISSQALELANPQIPNINVVTPGMPVCVPPDCCTVLQCSWSNAPAPAAAPSHFPQAAGACADSGSSTHNLGQGENLASIATTCSISPEALSTMNPQVPDQGSAYPGLPICVPSACCHSLPCSTSAAPAPAPAPALYSNAIPTGTCANINFSIHLLDMGEYLSALARSCGVATQVLVAGNPQIANPNVVTAGLPVCVPSACCASVQCLDAAAVGTDSSASRVPAAWDGSPSPGLPRMLLQGASPTPPSQANTNSAGRCSYLGYPSVHYLLPDEWISTVAMTCNVDTASLEVANSQIADFNNVTAGMSVCVPLACCQSLECTGGSDLAPAPSDSVVAEGSCSGSYSSVHELLPDEYIHMVAEACKVTTPALQQANPHIPDINNVTAGLPVCVPPACCSHLTCTAAPLAPSPTPKASLAPSPTILAPSPTALAPSPTILAPSPTASASLSPSPTASTPLAPSPSVSAAAAVNCSRDFPSVHLLSQNEWLVHVAGNCSLETQSLIDANPQIVNPDLVTPGTPVCVPSACCTSIQCSASDPTMQTAAPASGLTGAQGEGPTAALPGQQSNASAGIESAGGAASTGCSQHAHMVQPGENLTYIAQVCQVPLAFLKQTNTAIDDPDHIDIGTTVCVLSNCTDNLFAAVGAPASPGGTLVRASCEGNYGKHFLEEHEILADVALNCSMDVQDLSAANPNITDKDAVFAGQPVCVPKACCNDRKVVCSSLDASPAASPSTGSADAGSAVLWGTLSGVLAIILASVAFSAWLYVTLRHRKEKQLLVYGVITRLRTSNISSDSLSASPTGQIKAVPGGGAVSHNSIMLKDDVATDRMKRVAKDITTWCLLRWGGPFGARAGSDSVGAKLGIWNERFESVRCAVMLLAFHKVNAALIAEHQKARTGTDEPGTLMEAWEAADPSQKSALVTDISHTLLTIDRDSAQALTRKDEPVPSAYERISSMMHHMGKNWQSLSSKGARSLSRPNSGPVGPGDALIPSNGSHV